MKDGTTRKPSTINRELQILSRIFSLAIRYKVTDRNPCSEASLLPENNKRIRYLLDEEEHQLLSVLTGPRGHLLPLVVLAIGTGMSRGDLFNLTWERIDFQRGLVYVPNSKTGRNYSVPMRRRQSHVATDTQSNAWRRLRLHQSRHSDALHRRQEGIRDGLSISGY